MEAKKLEIENQKKVQESNLVQVETELNNLQQRHKEATIKLQQEVSQTQFFDLSISSKVVERKRVEKSLQESQLRIEEIEDLLAAAVREQEKAVQLEKDFQEATTLLAKAKSDNDRLQISLEEIKNSKERLQVEVRPLREENSDDFSDAKSTREFST
jgi:chromosome segregation ATPase